jgi:hypothetical protein
MGCLYGLSIQGPPSSANYVEGVGFPMLNSRIKPKDEAQLDSSLFGME